MLSCNALRLRQGRKEARSSGGSQVQWSCSEVVHSNAAALVSVPSIRRVAEDPESVFPQRSGSNEALPAPLVSPGSWIGIIKRWRRTGL